MVIPPLPGAFAEIKAEHPPGANAGSTGILPAQASRFRALEPGCYLVNYTPVASASSLLTYDGTIRITKEETGVTASGDLYSRPPNAQTSTGTNVILLGTPPNPAEGIPIFGRSNYRYYMRIADAFTPVGDSITVRFELWKFDFATNEFDTHHDGSYTALVSRTAAPSGWPSPNEYLEGDVKDGKNVVARLKMGLVSPMLRKISVEIDAIADCGMPLQNSQKQTWKDLLRPVGYEVDAIPGNDNIRDLGRPWSNAEMHKMMLVYRDRATNLDAEWRYYILCVKLIDGTDRGVMFDIGGTDSNKTPREGVGIAAKWQIPAAVQVVKKTGQNWTWGDEKGKSFDDAPDSYMRTAVHEIGHALGLVHPDEDTPGQLMDRTFMCDSGTIAQTATASLPYPRNIVWSHSRLNTKRLQHWPDVFIRPGGIALRRAQDPRPLVTPTDSSMAAPALKLRVDPVAAEVPLGAPVRLEVSMVRDSEDPKAIFSVPADISLKSSFVSGTVKDPFGNTRAFSPLIRTLQAADMVELTAEHPEVTSSLTLMRGSQGALFPSVGLHEITVQVRWGVGSGVSFVVESSTTVLVTGIESPSHAAAAHKVLREPDVHLVLVLGGDHLTEGVEAIKQALADPTLAPHFAGIEARRLAQPFTDPESGEHRSADHEQAKKVLRDLPGETQCVFSQAEADKLKRLKLA